MTPRTSILPLLARANAAAAPTCRISTTQGGFLAARTLSSTTVRANKGPVETTKDTLHKADRTVSDAVLKGMDKGHEAAEKLKSMTGHDAQNLKGKVESEAGNLKNQAQGKTADLKGQAQGKTEGLKGQAQGKAEELGGKVKGEAHELKGDAEKWTGRAKGKAEELKGEAKEKVGGF